MGVWSRVRCRLGHFWVISGCVPVLGVSGVSGGLFMRDPTTKWVFIGSRFGGRPFCGARARRCFGAICDNSCACHYSQSRFGPRTGVCPRATVCLGRDVPDGWRWLALGRCRRLPDSGACPNVVILGDLGVSGAIWDPFGCLLGHPESVWCRAAGWPVRSPAVC
jgi:hypothetical protein